MQIRADVFPATVVVTPADLGVALEDLRSAPPTPGGYQVAIARVVITDGRILIAREMGSGPQIVFSEAINPLTYAKSPDIRNKDSYLETVSGKKIAFRKDSACGCGSRLRSWNPYGNMSYSVKDPTA